MAYQKLQPTQAADVILSDTINPINPSRPSNVSGVSALPVGSNKLTDLGVATLNKSGNGTTLSATTGNGTTFLRSSGTLGVLTTRSTGATDGVAAAFKLEDSLADFSASPAVNVGDTVRNSATNATALVTVIVSTTVLTLDTDIMPVVGQNYTIYEKNTLYDVAADFVSAPAVIIGDIVYNTTDSTQSQVLNVIDAQNIRLLSEIFSSDIETYEVRTSKTLYDSSADFITDGIAAGDIVYNTTDSTESVVVSVTNLTTLVLQTNIFQNIADAYQINDDDTLYDAAATFTTSPAVMAGDTVYNSVTDALTTVLSVSSSTTLVIADNIFTSTPQAYNTYTGQGFRDKVSIGGLVLNEATNTLTAVTAVSQTQLTFGSNVFPSAGVKFKAYGNAAQMNTDTEAFVVYVAADDASAETNLTIKVTTAAGNDISFNNYPLGTFLPVQCLRVWATGTDVLATNVVALW